MYTTRRVVTPRTAMNAGIRAVAGSRRALFRFVSDEGDATGLNGACGHSLVPEAGTQAGSGGPGTEPRCGSEEGSTGRADVT